MLSGWAWATTAFFTLDLPLLLLLDLALGDLSQLVKDTGALTSPDDSDSTLAGTDDTDFARRRATSPFSASQRSPDLPIWYILAMSIG